jgi:hypothetical protein
LAAPVMPRRSSPSTAAVAILPLAPGSGAGSLGRGGSPPSPGVPAGGPSWSSLPGGTLHHAMEKSVTLGRGHDSSTASI